MIKLLLVDDDSKFRTLFKRLILRKYDYKVLEALDGIQGLQIFEKENPNVIFLDIDLPNLNGRDFLREIRKKGNTTPVIILTNCDDGSAIKEIMALGINDYVLKTKFVTQMSDRLSLIMKKLKLEKDSFYMTSGF